MFDFNKNNNVFYWLKNQCNISEKELLKTFNCGIGMMLVSSKKESENVISICQKLKQPVKVIGKVTKESNIYFK